MPAKMPAAQTNCMTRRLLYPVVMVMVMVLNSACTAPLPRYL